MFGRVINDLNDHDLGLRVEPVPCLEASLREGKSASTTFQLGINISDEEIHCRRQLKAFTVELMILVEGEVLIVKLIHYLPIVRSKSQ